MVCEHRGRINSSDVIILSPLPKFASWNNSSIAVGTDTRISKTQTISGCVLTTVTSYRREVHEGAVINFQSSHPSPLPVRPLPLRNLTSLPHVGRRHSGERECNWTPRWLRKVPPCPAAGEHHPPSPLTQLMGLPQTCSSLPQTALLLSYIISPECAAHHDPPQASGSQSTTPPPSSFMLLVAEPAQENRR